MWMSVFHRSSVNVEGSVYGISCDPEGSKVAVQLTDGSLLQLNAGN